MILNIGSYYGNKSMHSGKERLRDTNEWCLFNTCVSYTIMFVTLIWGFSIICFDMVVHTL